MSTVLPNGTIRFLQNVPIDEDYQNSLDFLTLEAQREYFLGLTPVYTMIGATRVREGVIDVSINSDTLLPCNYLMFQNMDFYNKWFYAFITDIEYVNNNMTRVYYALDDIQTWLFDVELEECFVEREHTRTDGMFEHLVDEGINISEYVNNNESVTNKTYKALTAMLFVTEIYDNDIDPPFYPVGAMPCYGNFGGVYPYSFDVLDANGEWDTGEVNGLKTIIELYVNNNKTDAIVGMIMFPTELIGDGYEVTPPVDYLEITNYTSNRTLDGYRPKNKKMYNSPFCVIEYGTSDGQKDHLQPEYINDDCRLDILACVSLNASLMVVPTHYRGDRGAWDKQITLECFPQCALSIDGYQAWQASGGLTKQYMNIINSAVSGVFGTAGSIMSGNPTGAGASVMNAGTSIANSIVEMDIAKTLPSIIRGSNNPSSLAIHQYIRVYTRDKCANGDVIKSIDNYLTMYGYKVNKVKTPSRRNRPHYTYVKTKGCKVRGGAPADAINRIQIIYDNGIRFWVNASEVGHYTDIDNSPT